MVEAAVSSAEEPRAQSAQLHLVEKIPGDGTLEKPESSSPPPASDDAPVSKFRKPLSFYGAFFSLVIMVLLVSLDSTGLAVAIPVRLLTLMRG
jgi:hypothetical protein